MNEASANQTLVRKCLCFFIRDPEYPPNKNVKDLHFINYPFKMDIIFNYWSKCKVDIPRHIMMIIRFYAFGAGEHHQNMVSIMRKIHNPKWDRRLKVEKIIYKKRKPKVKRRWRCTAARKSAPACGD
eukprot:UN08912